MKIVEFKEKYPNYSLGFLADNPLTDTEKAFGKSMHLLFHEKRNKTYQVFTLPDYEINEMLKVTPKAGSGYCGAFIVKDVHIKLINDDGLLLGYCVETEERIAFNRPFTVSITL
jgi:hypothetical protein